jgi:molybdate transport system permease protein
LSFAAMSASARRVSPFWVSLVVVAGLYLLFLVAMLVATAGYTTPDKLVAALGKREIQYSIGLSLVTCTVTALLSLLLAVPVGYLLARARFPGKHLVEAALDIPIVLPPMVMGLCLLILFQTGFGKFIESSGVTFTYTVYGVVLAQFTIGAAFAVRTMRHTFDHLSARPEDVAMTLGCTRAQAVWLVTLPAARRGMFAAASRMKTEVLPTTVWLELSVGNLEAAVAVSLLMVLCAMGVLAAVKWLGEEV